MMGFLMWRLVFVVCGYHIAYHVVAVLYVVVVVGIFSCPWRVILVGTHLVLAFEQEGYQKFV